MTRLTFRRSIARGRVAMGRVAMGRVVQGRVGRRDFRVRPSDPSRTVASECSPTGSATSDWRILRTAIFLGCLVFLGFSTQSIRAQDPEAAKRPNANAKAKFTVENIRLVAKDGFSIAATWYQGDKETTSAPIILLHNLDQDRKAMQPLGEYFAKFGNCVICPDLRGHGESIVDPNGQEYLADRVSKAELLAMKADIEACKKFLIQKNDEKICNIEMLTIVADGAIGITAMDWCVIDWSFLPTTVKQGQDVKALVLLSPVRRFKGLSINELLRTPLISGKGANNPLDIAIVAGTQHKDYRDAVSIYSSLAAGRGRKKGDENDWTKHDLFFFEAASDTAGIELLLRHDKTLPGNMLDFLNSRVVDKADDLRWQKRSSDN